MPETPALNSWQLAGAWPRVPRGAQSPRGEAGVPPQVGAWAHAGAAGGPRAGLRQRSAASRTSPLCFRLPRRMRDVRAVVRARAGTSRVSPRGVGSLSLATNLRAVGSAQPWLPRWLEAEDARRWRSQRRAGLLLAPARALGQGALQAPWKNTKITPRGSSLGLGGRRQSTPAGQRWAIAPG